VEDDEGRFVCQPADRCKENRTGIKCFDCIEGHGAWDCIPCPASWLTTLAFIGAVLGAMASLAYLHHCSKQPEMPKTLTFMIDHCQLLSIIAACDLKWSCAARQMFNILSFADFSIAGGIGSSCALGLNYYWKMLLMSMSPLLLWLLGMIVVFVLRNV
jgi:hypothetical protein